jgi:hypothetical protein
MFSVILTIQQGIRINGSLARKILFDGAVILIAATGLFTLDVHIRNWAANTVAEVGSRTAANAGLTRAVLEMNRKLKTKPWDTNLPYAANERLPSCTAVYSYKVAGDAHCGYTVGSVGQAGVFTRHIDALLRLKSIFENAIYAKTKILLDNGARVDTQQGSIATDPSGEGTVVNNTAEVAGAVKTDSWELVAAAPPSEPPFDVSRGGISKSMTLKPRDSGRYDFIYLTGGKRLRIAGCDDKQKSVILYVTGDVAIRYSSDIEIDNDSALILYVGGNMTVHNCCHINSVAGKPERCLILGVGRAQSVWLDKNADFYGVIYAPDATVCMSNNTNAIGAVVGKYVTMLNQSRLKYDRSLLSSGGLEFGLRFVVDRWWQGKEW